MNQNKKNPEEAIKEEGLPNYLLNLIDAIDELNEVSFALKSKCFIEIKGNRQKSNKKVLNTLWLSRRKFVSDSCHKIAYDCNQLSKKIRTWLGYYEDF